MLQGDKIELVPATTLGDRQKAYEWCYHSETTKSHSGPPDYLESPIVTYEEFCDKGYEEYYFTEEKPEADYATESIDDINYNLLLRDYQQEQRTLNERLKTFLIEPKQEDNSADNFRKLKEVALQYAESELSSKKLSKLVSRIEIKHPEEINDCKQQEINIIYRFINTNINLTT